MKMRLSIIGIRPRNTLFLLSSGCLLGMFTAAPVQAQQLAFPGAVGHGAYATGGRSGTVYHVTNLGNSGSGSFRDAVSQPNRIVVFDVGGYINLSSVVAVANNITIAGQTAPGDGIGIMGHEVSFTSRSNEIVRYVRFRPGSIASSTEDGINMGDGTNMIFDHISIEFAPYNDIDAHGTHGPHKLTFQNSIIADPTGQQFGCHSEGLGGNITWYRNLWANAHNRQPMAKMNTVYINNVIYNYQAGYTVANTSGHFTHDIVNNYFITGPSTTSPDSDFFQMNSNQIVYAVGNLRDSDNNGTLSGGATTPSPVVVTNGPWSSWTTNMFTASTAGAYFYGLSMVGAFSANNNLFYNTTNSLYRDQVDSQVLGEVMTLGTSGHMWTSQTQSGLGNNGYGSLDTAFNPVDTDQDGIPDYWELANGMSTNDASDAINLGPTGYTRVEEYLNWLISPHAIVQSNSLVNVDLWQYTVGFTNASPVYAVSNATNGTVTLLGDGHTAQFTPTASYAGMAGFDYTVTAGTGDAMTDTVSVVVSTLAPPPLPPAAPSGLTATAASATQINLLWADNSTNEISFLIERSTDNLTFTQIASVGANVAVYTNTALLPGTTYYYRVRASGTGGNSGYSSTAQATTLTIPALTWLGDGVSNKWDLGISTNWFNGVGAAVFSNAAAVTFDNAGSASPPVSMIGALQPLSVAVTGSQNYTLTGSGSLTGTMGLTKSGSGQLTLATNDAYSGGTTLNAGTLTLSAVGAAGSGTITLNGGTLAMGVGSLSVGNPLNVAAASTLIPNSGSLNGSISGGGTLNVLPSSQLTLVGSMSSYTGTIALGTSSVTLRFYGSTGSSGAVFDLGAGTASMRSRNGNVSINVGALLGGPNTIVSGATVGGSNTGATTYVIGALNTDTTYRGTITEDSGRATSYRTAVTKVGSGTLTLTGTNAFSGGVKVNGGTLLVDGIQGMLSNSVVTVATNALLGGNGYITGRVTVQSGGAIAPGESAGILTVSNGLTLVNTTLYFDLASVTNAGSNDSIAMRLGTLTLTGTNTVVPNFLDGVLTNGTYTLVSGGAATAGGATNLAWAGPTGTRQTMTLSTDTPGAILLNVTGNAATLSWQGANGNVWDLNNTTNWNNGGVTDSFFNADAVIFDDTSANGNVDITGTVRPRSIIVTNSTTAYTVTSTNGLVAGSTTLTKLGSGTLTLNGSNSFSGGTTVSDGTLVVNGSNAAGTGPITLNGGTLTLGASIGNALNVAAASTLNPGGNTLSGAISGGSTLSINITGGNTFTVAGSMTSFSGTFELGASTGFLQFNGSLGSSNAVFDLGSGSATLNNLNGGVTINLGALTGGTNTTLSGATSASASSTYLIGGNNTTTNFDGRITDGFGPTAVTKVGSGTWTLTGTNNNYAGGTTVSSGTLLVNNTTGSGLGSGPVGVRSGATLGGSGVIEAPVSLDGGGILAPGGSSVGALTMSGDYLFLNSASVLQYALGTNSDLTVVTSDLTLAGVLNITDAGGFSTGTYTLFTYGGSLATNGSASILTIGTVPDTNLVYTVDISSNGYVNLIVAPPPPVAGFTASPTNGVAPLAVTFTDTSTNTITDWYWDFGDGGTTNFAAATNPVHTYSAGSYTVTLVVSGPGGVSTNTRPNYITVLTPFQSWQMQYFGCTDCPQAAADADPDGDGMSNGAEFLAGTDPTNSLSGLRIISTEQQGDDVVITWTTAGGRTNAVQATAGDADGGYTTNFIDLSELIILPGSGDTTTNYVDVAGATNAPARYYRIRLVP
jgi:autotransporter-associated beta strand protein